MADKAPGMWRTKAERRAKRRLASDAKHDGFTSLRRDREGSERPVPKGERKAEVPVEMGGISRNDAAGDGPDSAEIRPATPVNAIHYVGCGAGDRRSGGTSW